MPLRPAAEATAQDRRSPVQLLGQHYPRQHMWPNHVAKGQSGVGLDAQAGGDINTSGSAR